MHLTLVVLHYQTAHVVTFSTAQCQHIVCFHHIALSVLVCIDHLNQHRYQLFHVAGSLKKVTVFTIL